MNAKAHTCTDAICAALYDLHNAQMVLHGVIAGHTPCKKPRAAVVEYIDSAMSALKEASSAADHLPARGGAL